MNWLIKGFTCQDGSMDDGRVAAFLLVLTFIGNSIFAIYKGQVWEPNNYGIGAGALVAGIGVLFGQRKDY